MLKQEPTVRFKMHKVKKQWVVIGTAVTLAATGVALSNSTPVAASTQEPSSAVVSSQTSSSTASETSTEVSKSAQETSASSASSTTVANTAQKTAEQANAQNVASSSSSPSSSASVATKQAASSEAASSNGSATASSVTQVDASKVEEAAQAAKDGGVKVSQGTTETVKADSASEADVAAAKQKIEEAYQKQVAALNQALAQQKINDERYKSELAAIEAARHQYEGQNATDGVTSDSVQQRLHQSFEDTSTVKLTAQQGVADVKEYHDGSGTIMPPDETGIKNPNILRVDFYRDAPNKTISVLYQGLVNSYYTDANGNQQRIYGMKRTFTVEEISAARDDATLEIYADPTGGFWYNGISKVKMTQSFLDQNGNPINLADKTAYYTVSSLNNHNVDDPNATQYPGIAHVEKVSGGPNATAVTLLGSSVSLNDGYLYSVKGNMMATVAQWAKALHDTPDNVIKEYQRLTGKTDSLTSDSYINYDVWDNKQSKYFYYGAGLFSLSGNEQTITFESDSDTDADSSAHNPNVTGVTWATINTYIPDTPTPHAKHFFEDASYNFINLQVPPATPVKVADNEGKSLLAGDTSTQHISQSTGVGNNLTGFYIGDAIFKTADGRLPVSYNLSDFNVTDQNGNNVTSLGKFVVSDGTVARKAALLIKWVANEPDKLGDNMTYTLNTKLTTLKDGIQDQELDAGITPYGTTDIHHYDEYVPTPDKHWTLDNKVTDNQLYLNGDTATATIKANLPDRSKLQNELSKVTVTDDFSQFADKVTVASVKVLENGTDVSNLYNITINPTNVVLTRKDAKSTPAGVLSVVLSFKIKDNVPNGTLLTNKGSMTVNTDTETIPPVNIVTWNPKPHKDVELGQVQGDTSATANGQMVANGQQLTYPLSSDDLPANRTTEINDWHVVDHLPDGVQYNGYKAWIKGKDGKLEDITSHLVATATADNQVTYTADAALLARFNADKSVATATPIIDVFVTPLKDGLTFTNEYQLFINKHEVVSNQVTNHTPTPTPHKTEQNADGVTINGKTVLPGSTNSYQLTWNTGAYKGIIASDDQVAKGFGYVEDYPEAALDPQLGSITYKDSTGAAVKGISVKQYASLEDAPTAVQAFLKKAGITPKGAFLFFSVDDPAAFYQDYVVKGKDITLTVPMQVKQTTEGEYENIAYEIDFGNGHATEIIKNNIPKINPQKDVVASDTDNKSLNNSQIDLNGYFDYLLHGPVIEAGNGDPITQYGFEDAYDQKHDQFTGQYKAVLTTDVTLKNGSTLKKGTDITNQMTLKVNADGSLSWEVKADFLAQIDQSKSAFGVDLYAQMKRIASGDVYNTYDATVNGVKYISNRVHTTTPEPVVPVTPEKPVTPAQPAQPKATPQPTAAPVKQALASLPKTGDQQQSGLSAWGALALAATSLFGMLGLRKRRETN